MSCSEGIAQYVVITDKQTLTDGPHEHTIRETRNGMDLSAEAITRLCCDAILQRVVIDAEGVPINVGRAQRTATPAQWAALNTMHSTCAWAGCDRPIGWCQAHHILEWDHNGPTDLDNLVPLCSTHHHRVHEGHWTIKLLPNRTLKIYQPNGTHHTDTVPDRPQNWLKTHNRNRSGPGNTRPRNTRPPGQPSPTRPSPTGPSTDRASKRQPASHPTNRSRTGQPEPGRTPSRQ